MKIQLKKLPGAGLAMAFATASHVTCAAPVLQMLPLQNGTFDLPSIAPEKAKNYIEPQGWTVKNDAPAGDHTHGGPGLFAGYGPFGKGQSFFWNAPLGSLCQEIPALTYVVGGASDAFTLRYRYRFGSGALALKTSLLIGGVPVASQTKNLQAPVDWQDSTLSYTAKAADAGKTIGVGFDLRQQGEAFTQPVLAEVRLEVVTDKPLAGEVRHDGLPGDTNLRFVGRWDKVSSTNYKSNWGGAYLRARFTGTSVAFKGGSLAGGPTFMVSLDGESLHEVKELKVQGLVPGIHTLLLGSPGQNFEVAFQGLALDAGATTLPVDDKPLIEFVGDSITTGGGQTRPSTVNYAWQTAELLGSDHTQIAFSGRALTTGFGCAIDKAALDTQYFQLKNFNHLTDNPQVPWDFSYQPQIVIVNLGQNDQCGQEPEATFVASYISFVQKIRGKVPAAHIVAMRPFGGPYEKGVREAVDRLKAAGDARVLFVDTTDWLEKTDYVDGTHPNQAGHDKVAQKLAPLLQPLLRVP